MRRSIADYCRRTGHGGVVLGLSGGIDSAIVVALAVAALGPDAVLGVLMPRRYSSEGSRIDALASSAALRLRVVGWRTLQNTAGFIYNTRSGVYYKIRLGALI